MNENHSFRDITIDQNLLHQRIQFVEHIDIPLRWRGKTKCLPATDMKDLYRTHYSVA